MALLSDLLLALLAIAIAVCFPKIALCWTFIHERICTSWTKQRTRDVVPSSSPLGKCFPATSKELLSQVRILKVDSTLTSVEQRSIQQKKEEFLREYKSSYGYSKVHINIDELRAQDFSRLKDTVYVDHAGATLYGERQLRAAMADLSSTLYANPHSQSESSVHTTHVIEEARAEVLRLCNASPEHYSCVFMAGATAALRLVGEAFPWGDRGPGGSSSFWYTRENHNSVLGIREYALAKGATAVPIDLSGPFPMPSPSAGTQNVSREQEEGEEEEEPGSICLSDPKLGLRWVLARKGLLRRGTALGTSTAAGGGVGESAGVATLQAEAEAVAAGLVGASKREEGTGESEQGLEGEGAAAAAAAAAAATAAAATAAAAPGDSEARTSCSSCWESEGERHPPSSSSGTQNGTASLRGDDGCLCGSCARGGRDIPAVPKPGELAQGNAHAIGRQRGEGAQGQRPLSSQDEGPEGPGPGAGRAPHGEASADDVGGQPQQQQQQQQQQHLFALPAECNFSGARWDLRVVPALQRQLLRAVHARRSGTQESEEGEEEASSSSSSSEGGGKGGRCYVLLDAAKACASSPPDLTLFPADFVALSFYKIFGYPTGLGALLVRKDAAEVLRGKAYFGGGTVEASIADADFVRRRKRPEEWLEDGTTSFLAIAALRAGFSSLRQLGGMPAISRHVGTLTCWTARQLSMLRHYNGRQVCTLYGNHCHLSPANGNFAPSVRHTAQPRHEQHQHQHQHQRQQDEHRREQEVRGQTDEDALECYHQAAPDGVESECPPGGSGREGAAKQGPVVTFNLVRPDGAWVGYREVEQVAALCRIQLRTGCFCNPGACAKHLRLLHADLRANYEAGHVCWDSNDVIGGRPTGAVRVSFGYMSSFEDAAAVVACLEKYFVVGTAPAVSKPPLGIYLGALAPTLEPAMSDEEVPDGSTEEAPAGSGSGVPGGGRRAAVLEAIVVYPIKSCAGASVSAWPLSHTGLLYDREWLLLDDVSGRVLTQKKLHTMCQIRPSLDLEAGQMRVRAPGMPRDLVLPLHHMPTCVVKDGVRVCGDRTGAVAYGAEVAAWFSEALGVACTLVRQRPHSRHRHISSAVAAHGLPDGTASVPPLPSDPMSFANEGQFLLVSSASVANLNARLPPDVGGATSQIDVMRFRPNLVVGGTTPYVEDSWRHVSICGETFVTLGGCARCEMVNRDQSPLLPEAPPVVSKEPLLTLASYRRTKGQIMFGVLLGQSRTSARAHPGSLSDNGHSWPGKDDNGAVVLRVGAPVHPQ